MVTFAVGHFRPANAAVATVLVPNALWLFVGVLSYYVTPMAISHFEAPPPNVVSER